MKNFGKMGNHLGVFFVFLFILCFAWYWLHPVAQDLHMQILQILFYGFDGMNFTSFILGVIQSYIWGFVAVVLWNWACLGKKCKR